MPCYLLHMVEQPDRGAWKDPDLKDMVGNLPCLVCAFGSPPQVLKPSESVRCLARETPCWKTGRSDPADPTDSG